MQDFLTFDEFNALAQHNKRVAVFRQIEAGELTPIAIYRLLSDIYSKHGVMLENLNLQETNRYSYLCFDAIESLTIQQNDTRDPLDTLRKLQERYKFSTRDGIAKLISFAMGLMTYDMVRCFENIPDRHPIDQDLPLLIFHFYTLSIAFDHINQSILISTVIDVSNDTKKDYEQAQQKLDAIIHHLAASKLADSSTSIPCSANIDVDITDDNFIEKIKKAKEYIIAGDAFQIVLSRCFKREYSVDSLDIYKSLCHVSPSPFMFYFPTENSILLGASPERMVSVFDREIIVNPIAGTRKRANDNTDEIIKNDLLNDKKELAEHMMLVDLARNDVGAVSQPGSVIVNELLTIKYYSHVMHISSNVSGHLQDKYDAYDAFAATFPAGTLSGAPKIRAMEIIDELETSRRGIYGGAICRIDSQGNFDSCIAIRMASLRDGMATIRVGAGIVYDSDPESETIETQQKAQAMLHAIADAHGENYDTNHR